MPGGYLIVKPKEIHEDRGFVEWKRKGKGIGELRWAVGMVEI